MCEEGRIPAPSITSKQEDIIISHKEIKETVHFNGENLVDPFAFITVRNLPCKKGLSTRRNFSSKNQREKEKSNTKTKENSSIFRYQKKEEILEPSVLYKKRWNGRKSPCHEKKKLEPKEKRKDLRN